MEEIALWPQVLSSAGVASKRASETLIQSGVVTVNGKVILVPQHMVVASIDEVSFALLSNT